MRAAEWSSEGAVKNQQDVFLALIIRQADHVAGKIGQAEIGSMLVEGYTWHYILLSYCRINFTSPLYYLPIFYRL